MTDSWYPLPAHPDWRQPDRRAFTSLARALQRAPAGDGGPRPDACVTAGQASLAAAAQILRDLAGQGWDIRVDDDGVVLVSPPQAGSDPLSEKERVRRQERVKRDEQLRLPSVRRFIAGMEEPREFRGKFVSIFSLMRDGEALRATLERYASGEEADPLQLREVIDPYLQVVSAGARCEFTGLLLGDIWRYFRHTWVNHYSTTPGRTLPLLVRDRAAPFHPVIGIAALSSAVVQLRERDEWIGWQPQVFLAELSSNPTARMAKWLMERLRTTRDELYLDDLLEDGLYWPSLWDSPSQEAIELLEKEAKARRRDHHRFARQADFKQNASKNDPGIWRRRAESDLFRSKRCVVLADLLRARGALGRFLAPHPSQAGLKAALADPAARRAISGILRRAKAESAGTEIADLSVCGAIAPYNVLLGGKLVSMLAVSPSAVRAYHEKYADYASQIASGMAGRSIRRRANLVFVGTTSLYGSGSSQYNRIRVPASVLEGSADVVFRQLGRSRSFGTSHLSADAVASLVRLAEQSRTGVRVNSIFGEGVNPKLRKIRHGLDLLGWPSDVLLQHGRQRIIYGISLVGNLLPYLTGVETRPRYIFPERAKDDVSRISGWWMRRWLSRRIQSEGVLDAVARHRLDRPVRHGARVELPEPGPDGTGQAAS